LQTYLDPEACRTVHQELTLRRTKQQIAQWVPRLALPKLVEEIVYVPMRPEEEANYLEVFEKCQKLARKEVSMARNNQLVLLSLLLRCVQACIHPKLAKPDKLSGGGSSKMDAVAACISANGNKTLVFCKFVKEIRWMEEILREKGVETYHLQGSLTPEERVAMINGFQTSDCRNATFLIQIDCGGCGLNLEQATDVYVMSPHWNPCVEEQCVGRAHRQGQTSRVRVFKMVASLPGVEKHTIDHAIIQKQVQKLEMISKVLTQDDGYKKKIARLSREDFKSLFDLMK